jgi:hypothetical protein
MSTYYTYTTLLLLYNLVYYHTVDYLPMVDLEAVYLVLVVQRTPVVLFLYIIIIIIIYHHICILRVRVQSLRYVCERILYSPIYPAIACEVRVF